MLRLSSSVKFIRKVAAAVLLPLLASSCQLMMEDYDCETGNDIAKYINISISVSVDNDLVTRSPLGGEYGDGAESCKDRENLVNDITLIFYQDDGGINTTSDDAEVICVKKYAVRPYTDGDLPNNHNHKTGEPTSVQENEVLYTTGDQKLEETPLEVGQSYRVLIVANADVEVNIGDKIKTVRDKVFSSIYTGTGIGTNATNFVMTSESDATMSLINPTVKTSSGDNRLVYYFNCAHIERMAARIDYHTIGATYDATYGGYVYSTGNGDFYVVTKVTPFNLYQENEYLFKRIQENWTDATPSINYLGDETLSNYVVDPNTGDKDNTQTFSYQSPITENMDNGYTQAMNSLGEGQTYEVDGFDNVIIAYPMENTLMPSSHLKKYATGIAFEVKYYANTSAEPITRVYYHYLRHQGELATGSYQARQWNELSADESISSHNPIVPMNYGIVRNNIYRVSIEGLSTIEGTITIRIEEKDWRHVDNPAIYI